MNLFDDFFANGIEIRIELSTFRTRKCSIPVLEDCLLSLSASNTNLRSLYWS